MATISQSSDEKYTKKESIRKIFEYIKRYSSIMGGSVGLNTLCCWTMAKNLKENRSSKVRSIEHYFCCESLGFAMDISSYVFLDTDVEKYGACFMSNFISHGTSIPLIMTSDNTYSLSPSDDSPFVPFAWGRSGGSRDSN
jgi:hypothetical protein